MPSAYFDSIEFLGKANHEINLMLFEKSKCLPDISYEYELLTDFLGQFTGNSYKSYRSSCNTFLLWLFDHIGKPLSDVTKRDVSNFVRWLRNPPAELIGKSPQPTHKNPNRHFNSNWRPFVNNDSTKPYKTEETSLRTNLRNLSALYRYLMDEEYISRNPFALYLRGNRRLKLADSETIKYLSRQQWMYLYKATLSAAKNEPAIHERTLLLITMMYAGYLRISEVSERPGYGCYWSQFRKTANGWLFHVPRSKYGKSRSIEVCDYWLEAVVRYRRYLQLNDLPCADEHTPIFIRHKVASRGEKKGEIEVSISNYRVFDLVKAMFVLAAQLAEEANDVNDAIVLRKASPHWIRHSGISHDVARGRPLSHVQHNAGHEDLKATSKYVHSCEAERFSTIQGKSLF